jgi:hypothetical protein
VLGSWLNICIFGGGLKKAKSIPLYLFMREESEPMSLALPCILRLKDGLLRDRLLLKMIMKPVCHILEIQFWHGCCQDLVWGTIDSARKSESLLFAHGTDGFFLKLHVFSF